MQEEYIKERESEWSLNIDEFSIGESILGIDGSTSTITNKTSNSIEVFTNRKLSICRTCNGRGSVREEFNIESPEGSHTSSRKVTCDLCCGSGKTYYGINSLQWFEMRNFNKNFKKIIK